MLEKAWAPFRIRLCVVGLTRIGCLALKSCPIRQFKGPTQTAFSGAAEFRQVVEDDQRQSQQSTEVVAVQLQDLLPVPNDLVRVLCLLRGRHRPPINERLRVLAAVGKRFLKSVRDVDDPSPIPGAKVRCNQNLVRNGRRFRIRILRYEGLSEFDLVGCVLLVIERHVRVILRLVLKLLCVRGVTDHEQANECSQQKGMGSHLQHRPLGQTTPSSM